MLRSIKSREDINFFIDKTNSLHDGYIIGVNYTNNGITKIYGGHFFEPEKTKLVLRILVTSMWDAVVEIEFDGIIEWQIKSDQFEITDTSLFINNENQIVWADDIFLKAEDIDDSSYVIAESMKWRIIE